MNSELTTNPDRIIIYTRVSTHEQEDNHSLPNQLNHAIDYCYKNGLILSNEKIPEKNIYREVYSASEISNTSSVKKRSAESDFTTRPKLKKIIELALQKKFDHFIVYSRDRFSRSINEFFNIQFIFDNHNIKIHYTKPGELQNIEKNPFYNLYNIMTTNLNEYEAEMISTRVKSITKEAVKNGYWPGGSAPYGYKIINESIKKRKIKVFNSYRANKISEIFQFYIYYGYGYKKISTLMKEKYPNENWTKSKVEAIIKNETYTGKIVWNRRGGRRRPGIHESSEIVCSEIDPDLSLVSPEFWTHILKLRQVKQKDPKYYSTPYLLRGKLKCGICNKYMETKDNGKGKKKIYRCISEKNSISELIVDKDEIESLFLSKLNNIFQIKEFNALWLKYQDLISNMQKSLESSKKDIKEKINKVTDLRAKISHTLKSEDDETLKSFMVIQDMKLNNEELFWKEQYKILNSTKINSFSNHIEFKDAIINIFREFSKYSNESRRMLIDILIDEVVVNKIDNKIMIDMTVNPSQLFTK